VSRRAVSLPACAHDGSTRIIYESLPNNVGMVRRRCACGVDLPGKHPARTSLRCVDLLLPWLPDEPRPAASEGEGRVV
jgi:hypothetical protein